MKTIILSIILASSLTFIPMSLSHAENDTNSKVTATIKSNAQTETTDTTNEKSKTSESNNPKVTEKKEDEVEFIKTGSEQNLLFSVLGGSTLAFVGGFFLGKKI